MCDGHGSGARAVPPRRDRYPKHRPSAGPPMVIDGVDLGRAMTPQDLLVWLRVACHLDDDEIVPAMLAGADRVERDMADPAAERPVLAELPEDERREAVRAAREVTRSRVDAWRRRHRHMTWGELRVLFVGLREPG